ncbi:MAG: hypothetical protein R2709_11945 [Marmoricola sp.]
MTSSAPAITNLGQLRASGHVHKSLRQELRDNLLAMLRAGEDPWPGLHGWWPYTLEQAMSPGTTSYSWGSGAGARPGCCALTGLLDEWTPVIDGAELGEHPYGHHHASKRLAAELGDDLPVAWRHRDERYAEKLATPDTSVADPDRRC